MTLLPRLPVEFIVQLRPHCGMRAYAVAGRIHVCGVCDQEVPVSDNEWELYKPDVTPLRGEVIT
jgi:hypothetical protein